MQERSRATVAAILTAAAQVFEEHGYAAGTTNRIAERAGVSIGTLYQYFPDKDAVALALLDRHMDAGMRLFADLAQRAWAQPTSARATLQMFVNAMLELHADHPRLHHLLLEELHRPPAVEALLHRMEDEVAQAVAQLLRRYPEVRHPDLTRAATMVTQVVEDLAHRYAAHPSRTMSRRQFADELVRMVEAYLTAPW